MQRLRDAGVRVMVLSGDNVAAARALAGRAGIRAADVTAGVGPGGKVDFVEQLRRGGAVRSPNYIINPHPSCHPHPVPLSASNTV